MISKFNIVNISKISSYCNFNTLLSISNTCSLFNEAVTHYSYETWEKSFTYENFLHSARNNDILILFRADEFLENNPGTKIFDDFYSMEIYAAAIYNKSFLFAETYDNFTEKHQILCFPNEIKIYMNWMNADNDVMSSDRKMIDNLASDGLLNYDEDCMIFPDIFSYCYMSVNDKSKIFNSLKDEEIKNDLLLLDDCLKYDNGPYEFPEFESDHTHDLLSDFSEDLFTIIGDNRGKNFDSFINNYFKGIISGLTINFAAILSDNLDFIKKHKIELYDEQYRLLGDDTYYDIHGYVLGHSSLEVKFHLMKKTFETTCCGYIPSPDKFWERIQFIFANEYEHKMNKLDKLENIDYNLVERILTTCSFNNVEKIIFYICLDFNYYKTTIIDLFNGANGGDFEFITDNLEYMTIKNYDDSGKFTYKLPIYKRISYRLEYENIYLNFLYLNTDNEVMTLFVKNIKTSENIEF